MAGNTATIDVAALRVQWDAHIPIAQLCSNFTVTRDQMTRLKFVFGLPPRHDRRLRHKPPRAPRPDAAELAASEASLNLAPQIAERVTVTQAAWTFEVRMSRRMAESSPFMLRWIESEGVIRRFLDRDDAG